MSDFVIMGRVVGLFGVKGWVKIKSYTQPRKGLLDYETWHLGRGDEWVAQHLEKGKPHGKGLVAKFKGYDDRDKATVLLRQNIAVTRDQLPKPEGRDYYWIDLIGLRVMTLDGKDLGVVEELLETGSNDVLVAKGERERLIPFILDDVIIKVDLIGQSITVDWDPEF